MKRFVICLVLFVALSADSSAQNIVLPSQGALHVRQGVFSSRVHYNSGSRFNRFYDSVDTNGPGRRQLIGDLGGQFIKILPDILPILVTSADGTVTTSSQTENSRVSQSNLAEISANLVEIQNANAWRSLKLTEMGISKWTGDPTGPIYVPGDYPSSGPGGNKPNPGPGPIVPDNTPSSPPTATTLTTSVPRIQVQGMTVQEHLRNDHAVANPPSSDDDAYAFHDRLHALHDQLHAGASGGTASPVTTQAPVQAPVQTQAK